MARICSDMIKKKRCTTFIRGDGVTLSNFFFHILNWNKKVPQTVEEIKKVYIKLSKLSSSRSKEWRFS